MPATAIPNYPVYEPYDLPVDPPNTANWTMASIGEYGLDINNGAIANPNDAEDFMSYCGPRWMSMFTYQLSDQSRPAHAADDSDRQRCSSAPADRGRPLRISSVTSLRSSL